MDGSRSKSLVKREVQELLLLFEISQVLDESMDLGEVVKPVLEAMSIHMGMERGTITLLNRESGEIMIEAAHGLSEAQKERGRYRQGEGVTGKVIATGEHAAVPHISEEPMFLDRTRARRDMDKKDVSFVCVPIKLGNEVIGALSADRLFEGGVSFEEDVRLLSIIASMISQAVRLRRSAQEERHRLLEENFRLQRQLKERFRPSNIVGKSKTMQVVYDRNVHTVAYHHPLKQTIPLEGCSAFGGKGLDLNPIDLVAMAVASCLMIVMGKTAEAEKLDIVGAKADTSYDLVNYRIAAIKVTIRLPKKLAVADQTKLESASKKCPVFLAIHPHVRVTVDYVWPQ